jgi:carbamoyl-phosphate synthase/aspartate carbamoyltransferase/dihydroorotase
MVGYPEILTDPSHKNHILVLTYPLIGNYGVPSNDKDQYGLMKYLESNKVHISGLVINECIDDYSHYQGIKSLRQWLIDNNIPTLYDIDTRELTKIIREEGSLLGMLSINKNISTTIDLSNIQFDDSKAVNEVSIKKPIIYNPNGKHKVMVIDCGIKHSQLRMLLDRDCHIKLVPWNHNILDDTFLDNNCKLLISNGPSDPMGCSELIDNISKLMNSRSDIGIFGICLGHQILGLASGCKTYKMKYGNRGVNLPCQLVGTNKCYITSQNHGYAINKDTIPNDWSELFVNVNDNTNEGIYHKSNQWFSVQFHPEAKTGPTDTGFLFDIFLEGNIHDYIRSINKEDHKIECTDKKILILGSGALSIGQSGEFDYSGSQAIKAYKEEGLVTVLVNPNIATIQTSPGFADKVYFDPIDVNHVTQIIKLERPDYITLSFGGQTTLNLAVKLNNMGILDKYNVKILGTPISSIICTEDRDSFKDKVLSIGESIPNGLVSDNFEDAYNKGLQIGFPLL